MANSAAAVLDEPGLHDERGAGNDGRSSRSSAKGCGVHVCGVARPAVASGVDAVAPAVTVDAAAVVGKTGTRMRHGGTGSADHDGAGVRKSLLLRLRMNLPLESL